MPSQAHGNFRYNLVDVDRLIQSHTIIKSGDKGKQGLGHITRSGVVMLCAAWELYIEELVRESVGILSDRLDLPTELPLPVQKELSRTVKSAKHELRPLHLAGDGWKQVYRDRTNGLAEKFNTPKVNNISDLFERLVGIEDLTATLSVTERDIDSFVTARGGIAHKGRHAAYVKMGKLVKYKDMMVQVAIEIDNLVSDFLRDHTNGKKPWNVTSK